MHINADTPMVRPEMLSSQIGVRVARKALDAQEQQGEAAIALIKAAAKVQDQVQAQATADGRLDVTA